MRERFPREGRTIKPTDRLLPIANISRIMRRPIPPSAKVSKEAKEMMQKAGSEFIAIVTCVAKEICLMESRKTIVGEDLIRAMDRLGMPQYADLTRKYFIRYKEGLHAMKFRRRHILLNLKQTKIIDNQKILAPMNTVDEIEFFNFVPVAFIKDILNKSLAALEELGKDDAVMTDEGAFSIVKASMIQNFYLLENYLSRNVFRFPDGLSFERKITDVLFDEDLCVAATEFRNIIAEEIFLRNLLSKKEGDIIVEEYKGERFDKILKCIDRMDEVLLRGDDIDEEISSSKRMYEDLRSDTVSNLDEFRDLKNEANVIERNELEEIMPCKVIDTFLRTAR